MGISRNFPLMDGFGTFPATPPRYAAQREASMAESLAYVAARLGGGVSTVGNPPPTLGGLKVEGSETREYPKDGNHFHLGKWSFFFSKDVQIFHFSFRIHGGNGKKDSWFSAMNRGHKPPFQEQADRTTQRAGGWDLHGWCRCQLSQQLKLPCCDFSREGASAKVCYDLGGGYIFRIYFDKKSWQILLQTYVLVKLCGEDNRAIGQLKTIGEHIGSIQKSQKVSHSSGASAW